MTGTFRNDNKATATDPDLDRQHEQCGSQNDSRATEVPGQGPTGAAAPTLTAVSATKDAAPSVKATSTRRLDRSPIGVSNHQSTIGRTPGRAAVL
jgi:hypothetical protein